MSTERSTTEWVLLTRQSTRCVSARATGHHVVIVTGRRWEELGRVVPTIVELTDRVVCEEGGVLVNVNTGQLTLLADPCGAGATRCVDCRRRARTSMSVTS